MVKKIFLFLMLTLLSLNAIASIYKAEFDKSPCAIAINKALIHSSYKEFRNRRLIVADYEISDDQSELTIRIANSKKNEFGYNPTFAWIVYNANNRVIKDVTKDPDEPVVIKYDTNASKSIEKYCGVVRRSPRRYRYPSHNNRGRTTISVI